jgi:beta-aspartyl-peptidase (threonine type)
LEVRIVNDQPFPRRALFLGSLAILLVTGVPGAAELPEAAPVKKEIVRVLNGQVLAWNKGDLEGFMQGYWKSPDLTFFSGKEITKGWQATLERYRKRYQAEGKEMGKLTFSDLEIEVVGPDSAFVRGRWKVVTSKETLGGLFTLLFKKRPEGWRIVHDHTSAG